MIRVRLFGGFEIFSESGDAVRLATRKTRLTAAALALAPPQGVSRSELCRLLWPDRQPVQARASLRQALVAIRRAMGRSSGHADAGGAEPDMLRLSLPDEAIDVRQFRRLMERPTLDDALIAAELYRGEVLSGVDLPGEVEDRLGLHRRSYHRAALRLVEHLSEAADLSDEQLDAAEALADRLLAIDQTTEEAHRALIRLHIRRGRRGAAIRQFELCRLLLRKELALEPEEATSSLVGGMRPQPTSGAPVTVKTANTPSVVVLPFQNLSGPADDYFVDGIVEEVTSALSRVRDFFVIARQSALAFRSRVVDVREVGETLGVAYAVEGMVRRGGDRLRISVRLIDTATRQQLWSDRFEGTTTDVFALQDDIAAKVAGAMSPALRQAEIERVSVHPTTDLRAYGLVLRAYPGLWGENAAAVRNAGSLIEQALIEDPAYGRARALLAWCHALKLTYLWSEDDVAEERACAEAIELALPSIGHDPTALTACGAAASLIGAHDRGEALLSRALALDPNNAWAWTRFGWLGLYRDQPEAAKERFERAMILSPLDPFLFNMEMGFAGALALAGQLASAVALARDVVNKHPHVTWAYRILAGCAGASGDDQTARWAAQRLLAQEPHYTVARYRAVPAFRGNTRLREMIAAGMARAGVPEG